MCSSSFGCVLAQIIFPLALILQATVEGHIQIGQHSSFDWYLGSWSWGHALSLTHRHGGGHHQLHIVRRASPTGTLAARHWMAVVSASSIGFSPSSLHGTALILTRTYSFSPVQLAIMCMRHPVSSYPLYAAAITYPLSDSP